MASIESSIQIDWATLTVNASRFDSEISCAHGSLTHVVHTIWNVLASLLER